MMPAPLLRRRHFLAGLLGIGAAGVTPAGRSQERRFRVAFANLNEEPGARLEGLGFNGLDVRRSFELAARTLPLDMIYYDNGGDPDRALANADGAIRGKVDLLIEYNADAAANSTIARKMAAARIRVLALNHPVPGAPLYTADNLEAGRIAGKALGEFAKQTWPDETVVAAVVGDFGDVGPAVADRVRGIEEALRQIFPGLSPARLDSSGNPARAGGVLGKFLATQPKRKILVATLDDAGALAAKGAIEFAGRQSDCAIVGQGADRAIHGGASEKKEIDPNNRGSVVIGSVAYYLDRYGYDVLPLALRMLRGEEVPARTTTKHILISARNVYAEYPPHDMN